jgi:flavin reductase (DIM6/NTAB) family NADH-FMN oxidoreductase RutF
MRQHIGTYEDAERTIEKLSSGGLLITTGEKGNPMTIGWGMVGLIWGRPVFTILVRPSRYSFQLLETLPEFVVNVPTPEMRRAVAVCGSKSGRDIDKIAECGLSLAESEHVRVPHIQECPVQYECRLIHKTNVVNGDLATEIVEGSYPEGDFHRIYHGQILGVYRNE